MTTLPPLDEDPRTAAEKCYQHMRTEGVRSVRIETEDGVENWININAKRWKGLLAFVLLLFTLLTSIAAVLRVGVQHEVQVYSSESLDQELARPNGKIAKEIDSSIASHEKHAMEQYNADMQAIRTQLGVVNEKLQQAEKERNAQHDELMQLLRRRGNS